MLIHTMKSLYHSLYLAHGWMPYVGSTGCLYHHFCLDHIRHLQLHHTCQGCRVLLLLFATRQSGDEILLVAPLPTGQQISLQGMHRRFQPVLSQRLVGSEDASVPGCCATRATSGSAAHYKFSVLDSEKREAAEVPWDQRPREGELLGGEMPVGLGPA